MTARLVALLAGLAMLLTSCASVDLQAEVPPFETGIDSDAWAAIPAGEFLEGQFAEPAETGAYEIMITNVTTAQYAEFINEALAEGAIKLDGDELLGHYPGDVFRGYNHEEPIEAGDWLLAPLADPSQRVRLVNGEYVAQEGYENHPMTMVTWFGARAYCQYYDYRVPTELEWEKAARGTQDDRPYPWGDEIKRENANFYASRDPFEDMSSYGSRTTPVGFYNGQNYDGYQTLDSASPYGLYDMAGNVWQWTSDVYENMHYRFMRGGSKDTYDMDLRIWVRNNATPTYASPGVGFRCVRDAS